MPAHLRLYFLERFLPLLGWMLVVACSDPAPREVEIEPDGGDDAAQGGDGVEAGEDEDAGPGPDMESPPIAQMCAAGTWNHDRDSETPCVPYTECAAGQIIKAEGTRF